MWASAGGESVGALTVEMHPRPVNSERSILDRTQVAVERYQHIDHTLVLVEPVAHTAQTRLFLHRSYEDDVPFGSDSCVMESAGRLNHVGGRGAVVEHAGGVQPTVFPGNRHIGIARMHGVDMGGKDKGWTVPGARAFGDDIADRVDRHLQV